MIIGWNEFWIREVSTCWWWISDWILAFALVAWSGDFNKECDQRVSPKPKKKVQKAVCNKIDRHSHTVDGRNPAPVDGSLSHYLQEFIHPRWWSPDFFHQQYVIFTTWIWLNFHTSTSDTQDLRGRWWFRSHDFTKICRTQEPQKPSEKAKST